MIKEDYIEMDKGVHELRRKYWRQIIRECNAREQGITKLSWFREHNINSKSDSYWQKQFRSEAVASIKGDDVQDTAVSATVDNPVFFDITASIHTPVEEKPDLSGTAVQQLSNPPELMIQISDCRIFINNTIQEKTLETVMKVLRHA